MFLLCWIWWNFPVFYFYPKSLALFSSFSLFSGSLVGMLVCFYVFVTVVSIRVICADLCVSVVVWAKSFSKPRASLSFVSSCSASSGSGITVFALFYLKAVSRYESDPLYKCLCVHPTKDLCISSRCFLLSWTEVTFVIFHLYINRLHWSTKIMAHFL